MPPRRTASSWWTKSSRTSTRRSCPTVVAVLEKRLARKVHTVVTSISEVLLQPSSTRGLLCLSALDTGHATLDSLYHHLGHKTRRIVVVDGEHDVLFVKKLLDHLHPALASSTTAGRFPQCLDRCDQDGDRIVGCRRRLVFCRSTCARPFLGWSIRTWNNPTSHSRPQRGSPACNHPGARAQDHRCCGAGAFFPSLIFCFSSFIVYS